MTVINDIEIDDIQYNKNEIKEAILNNDPIDNKLHVITVISNPCLFARRYILTKEFITRIETEEPNVILYVVELAYGKQQFLVTKKKNKRHLQLRCETPLWHKENMINLGISKLLPLNWKAVAWIDADVEFENSNWVTDTLKILNGSKDIVQLFSHCVDMNPIGEAMKVFSSWGYQYIKKLPYSSNTLNYWHPGYAWACTRKAYDRMGGLFDKGILGSSDNIMALSYLHHEEITGLNADNSQNYKDEVFKFRDRVKNLRIGYVPGIIRHYYHGTKANRKYGDRWKILVKHQYSPNKHITYDNNGLIIPTAECPVELLNEIFQYFQERNEDDIYKNKNINVLLNKLSPDSEGFSVGSPQRGLQPCTTKGGAEEPRSGIFPKVKPRSSLDVMRADDRRSDCCAISTDDDEENSNGNLQEISSDSDDDPADINQQFGKFIYNLLLSRSRS
jgi:hypothetical protein